MLTVKSLRATMSSMEALEALVGTWLDSHRSANTRAAYAADLAGFLSWCDTAGLRPLDATSPDLDRYRQACLAAGASASTVARRMSAVASFFRYAESRGAVEAGPSTAAHRPGGPPGGAAQALGAEEMRALLRAAAAIGPKTAALVSLLALDGLKLGEALGLDISALRLGRRSSVDVRRHGRPSTIPVGSRSARMIAAYVGDRRRGPLFTAENSGAKPARLTRFGAHFLIKRAGAAAGISRPVSANLLRRSYADSARRAGRSLKSISHHLGHLDRRDTARLLGAKQ